MASQRAVLKLSHQTRAGQWALRHCLGYLLSLENVSSGVSPYPNILLKYPPNHTLSRDNLVVQNFPSCSISRDVKCL